MQASLFDRPAQSLDDLFTELDRGDGLRWYQRECVDSIKRELENNRSTLAVLATGLGKAQPLSAKVLTPTGWQTMGGIQPTDEIIGSDGQQYKVLSKHPQGAVPIYRVAFSDGASTRVCGQHLWSTWTASQLARGKGPIVLSTEQILADMKTSSGHGKWFTPVVAPVEFRHQSLAVDPWLLGMLIGDGCLRRSGAYFSTVDHWIIARTEALGFTVKKLRAKGCDYAIVQGRVGRKGGALINALKSLGAYGFLAHEKRIPDLYLHASHEDRLELLRGLMDTDGYACGCSAEITTSSEGLASDIVELVRSLGGVTRARKRKTQKRDAWRVRVNTPENPFSMPRKAVLYVANGRSQRSRSIVSIEPDGVEEAACIRVTAKDSLYVTDDYIVTHNTQIFCNLAREWDQGPVLVLAHRDELISQAKERLESIVGDYVDVEQAEHQASFRSRYVVGSIDSVRQAKRLERMGHERFSLVVIDEAHHAVSDSYRKVLDWFGPAKVLGVTATPDRGDEKALGAAFDSVAFVFDIEQGIDDGYLVPLKGRHVDVEKVDISQIKKTAGELQAGDLDEVMFNAVAGIVSETLRLEPDRQAVAFFPGVRSAELAAQTFNEKRPGSACFVSGKTPRDERAELVRDFKAGRYKYFCNCQVAIEGFDAPSASMIIDGAPTLSRARYAQKVGRGTRVLPGVVDSIYGQDRAAARRAAIASSLKPDTVIVDFVANSGKHDLVTPEDLLGGDYSEEEVALAKKARKRGTRELDPREELEKARAELRKLASQAKSAKVSAKVRDFDPFRALRIDMADEQRFSRFGAPMSAGQWNALEKLGVPEEDLRTMSRRGASKLLEEVKTRRKANLCSYKQARWLSKYGADPTQVSFERATKALDYIFSCRKGSESFSAPRLHEILNRQRQPGEDA